MSNSKVKVIAQKFKVTGKGVAKVVSATSSERLLVNTFRVI